MKENINLNSRLISNIIELFIRRIMEKYGSNTILNCNEKLRETCLLVFYAILKIVSQLSNNIIKLLRLDSMLLKILELYNQYYKQESMTILRLFDDSKNITKLTASSKPPEFNDILLDDYSWLENTYNNIWSDEGNCDKAIINNTIKRKHRTSLETIEAKSETSIIEQDYIESI